MYVCGAIAVKASGERHLPGSFINEVEEALVETAKEVSFHSVNMIAMGRIVMYVCYCVYARRSGKRSFWSSRPEILRTDY